MINKQKINILIAISIIINSCSPKISTHISQYGINKSESKNIRIFGYSDSIPGKKIKLGVVKIGDTGFSTNCDYTTVIKAATNEAKKAGGNALRIIEHKIPNSFSTCHRIKAEILEVDSLLIDTTLNYKYINTGELQISKDSLEKIIKDSENEKYSKWRFTLNSGYSYRIARVDDSLPKILRDYQTKSKSGFHVNFNINYFTSKNLSFGVEYSRFISNNSLNNAPYKTQNGGTIYGKMQDNVQINYYAPTISYKGISKNEKNVLIVTVGYGYLSYMDNAINFNKYLIYGNTTGLVGYYSYERKISNSLFIGAQISSYSGLLNQITLDDGVSKKLIDLKTDKISLSRLDFSIGIRIIN